MAALTTLVGLLAALAGATTARPATRSGAVTLTALFASSTTPAYDVLIPNFERAYPNITLNPTYVPNSTSLGQLEVTELAAGNAPDVLQVAPGCGASTAVCRLAKAGYLAPLVKRPWTKRSLPLVISASKYGAGLFTFVPGLSFEGLFTNDTMFRTLGLKVPQTFPELLDVCRKAKAAGTIPLLISLNASTEIGRAHV